MFAAHTSVVSKSDVLVVDEPHSHDEASDIHSMIGLSLVLGFVFMLLIDQLSMSRSRGIHLIYSSLHGVDRHKNLIEGLS